MVCLGSLVLTCTCWIAKDIVVLLVICRIAALHDIALGPRRRARSSEAVAVLAVKCSEKTAKVSPLPRESSVFTTEGRQSQREAGRSSLTLADNAPASSPFSALQ